MTYGSQIWISEFKINFNVIDKLLLEKIKNMIFKNILGVHSKASTLPYKLNLDIILYSRVRLQRNPGDSRSYFVIGIVRYKRNNVELPPLLKNDVFQKNYFT